MPLATALCNIKQPQDMGSIPIQAIQHFSVGADQVHLPAIAKCVQDTV